MELYVHMHANVGYNVYAVDMYMLDIPIYCVSEPDGQWCSLVDFYTD